MIPENVERQLASRSRALEASKLTLPDASAVFALDDRNAICEAYDEAAAILADALDHARRPPSIELL